jgi:DNA polymerase IV
MDVGRIRKIIHIDMDAFYASVEQRDKPTLKGKPVAVGYPAKRGVVAAASYEARRFGVRSAMPSTIAMRKCSELVFVPPRFDVYREVSNQIHAIFKDYTPLVEPLSLDEAYLDVTDNLRGIPTAWETAKAIRARIYEEIRLTASAGISCNKFLAKLASDYRKPNGQFAIMPDDAEAFVATLPVAKFHGVGPKTAVKIAPSALRRARICGGRLFLSFRTTSASQGVGTTTSREVGTTDWSSLTANESRRDRRRLFQRT